MKELFTEATTPATAEQINKLKRALKLLREKDRQTEEYIQILIEKFPDLKQAEYMQIMLDIKNYLSGHYTREKMPRLCPGSVLGYKFI